MLFRTSALVLATLLALAHPAAAQNISSASIDGVVTDATGGALPGVTVTITGPALQVPQLVQTTDGQGHYRFIDLPRGVYQLRFEIQGFDPLVRQALEVNAGFAARVNVAMKIGSVQETVTVSGASPVVDLTTTRGGQNVSTDLISIALPGLRQMADVIAMTPGLHSTDGYKPGAIGLNGRSRFNTYGLDSGNTNVTIMVDGFKIIANSQPDFANSLETDVKTYGNSAEVKEAGALINIITKSGGNDFHGRYSESYMRQPQSNLTPELSARGLSVGTSLQYYNDLFGDLGGRIVRDKVWFFGSMRDRRNKTSRPGLVLDPGPDGVYLTGDEPAAFPKSVLDNPTIKGSFQLTPKFQLVADYAREVTNSDADYQKTIFAAQSTSNPDFTHIAFEATQAFRWVPTRWKLELKGTPNNHLLFDAQFGRSTYLLDYTPQSVCGLTPPTYDRNTLMLTGCALQQQSDFTMWVADGSLTYVPSRFLGGSHELKMGYQLSARDITGNSAVTPQGNYALMFDLVNGQRQGVQFETSNSPVNPVNWDNVYSAYIADQWRLGQRLTFNLGLRYDYQHSYVPEQTREPGPWAPAATYPRVEVGSWGHFAPRAAVAFDLTGSGKTVAKASYAWFNTEAALSGNYNQQTIFTTDYRWHDLNNDGRYQPGEVNLDTSSSGPDFISTTSAANTPPNPNLGLSHIQEVSASLEREIAPNLAARVLYVMKRSTDDFSSNINVLRPFSAYNIPITRRDPGPDGVLSTADDGGLVTIYDYDPAFRGSNFVSNQTVNRPDGRSDYYNSFEGSVTRRLAGSWSLLAAYTATKYHKWLVGVPQSPNETAFDLDDQWRWSFKLNGNYNLPHDFLVGAIVEVVNGALGQRTYVFRATDASGAPLRQLATVTMRLEPYGAQSEAHQTQFNVRVGKKVAVGKKALNLSFDVLNVMNSSAITAVTYVSGPSFGRVTDILPPRTLRGGVTFDF
jgi:hypothetical protein